MQSFDGEKKIEFLWNISTRYFLPFFTVTPSKLVSLSASRNRSSHSRSLYWKSAMVLFRVPLSCADWCTLRATSCIAKAAVHTPSYVYPWNREYSSPRLISYSCWYSLEVCEQHETISVFFWKKYKPFYLFFSRRVFWYFG